MRRIFSRMEVPSRSSGSSGPESETSYTLGPRTCTVEEMIAEGGFAVVLLVKSGGRKMALKRLYVNNDRDLAVCKREISIVSNLNGHPHLIGYIDSSVSRLRDGVTEILLLMPYHKTTLLSLMNEKMAASSAFTEAEVLEIFTHITLGVGRLHHCSTPIIHRDLKVENVLRSDEKKYILCDFGSATTRVLNPSTMGINVVEEEIRKYTTLPYRSPEMVDLYCNKPLTTKLDIWALGVLLYHLCFFTLPFGESTLAIQSASFTFPKKPDYSDKLLKLIRYLLTPDMDARPDIFQATHLAFGLLQKETPLQNLHNVSIPNFDDISLTGDNNRNSSGSASTRSSNNTSAATKNPPSTDEKKPKEDNIRNKPVQQEIGDKMTSITPRQRPKGSKCISGGTVLPLPSLGTSEGDSGTAASSKLQTDVPPQNTVKETVSHGANNGNWNPFSESKFSQLSEDAIFGAQFDKMRQETCCPTTNPQPNMNSHVNNSSCSKRDPFGSAPFPLFKKE